MDPEEYVEAVLSLVERIPPGRVMSYGAIADALAPLAGRGSARRVGTIMARYGGGVPWHRVVAADGRLPPGHEREAGRRLAAEGTPMRGDRVNMRAAAWDPPDGDPAPFTTHHSVGDAARPHPGGVPGDASRAGDLGRPGGAGR